jgi:hypothetical protein
MLRAAVLCATALLAASGWASHHRSTSERHAFQREQPCPATGQRRGSCPGYVIDHVMPLACGGPDHRSNMQWQTKAEAWAKDRWERRECKKP